ncbi:hypothetical protein CEQ90_16160 [Lewinellaceae bacterium SD302]|nr:hypothetical protein CEQ90_16160 [Lewinellaceae bacterium SD302]
MSKFDEKMEAYKKSLAEADKNPDNDLLHKVAKGLGPSIYNNDANKVACSDKAEVERLVQNYAVKKLGASQEEGEKAAAEVCKEYNVRAKHRAVFYYLLCKKLGKESHYA